MSVTLEIANNLDNYEAKYPWVKEEPYRSILLGQRDVKLEILSLQESACSKGRASVLLCIIGFGIVTMQQAIFAQQVGACIYVMGLVFWISSVGDQHKATRLFKELVLGE